MKQLTEAQAWREIARRLETHSGEGYLCIRIAELQGEDRIALSTCEVMERRVEEHLDGAAVAYPSRLNPDAAENRRARQLAALLLAEEAKADAKRFKKSNTAFVLHDQWAY